VKHAFTEYLQVEVFKDTVPLEQYSPAIKGTVDEDRRRADASANADFENTVFNDISVPFYAILEPQADGRVLVVDAFGGKIDDVADFTRFVTGKRALDKAKLAAR
jgi:hypothetical protein